MVSSITASSISLSWSVASGRVASWEVVWRPTDRGTESTSGSLSGNTYTIHHLNSSTNYTVTVTATNVAGTTNSTPILFSTGGNENTSFMFNTQYFAVYISAGDNVQAQSTSEIGATIGGVVGAVVIIAIMTVVVHVVIALFLRSRRGNYSTSAENRHMAS